MVPHGKEHQLGDVLEVMLSHDVGAMGLYRLDRDDQHVGDLPVAVAFGQQFQDLVLPPGELARFLFRRQKSRQHHRGQCVGHVDLVLHDGADGGG